MALAPLVANCRLSYPGVCRIEFSQPGVKPQYPALEGRFLTTGPLGKLLLTFLTLHIIIFEIFCPSDE